MRCRKRTPGRSGRQRQRRPQSPCHADGVVVAPQEIDVGTQQSHGIRRRIQHSRAMRQLVMGQLTGGFDRAVPCVPMMTLPRL